MVHLQDSGIQSVKESGTWYYYKVVINVLLQGSGTWYCYKVEMHDAVRRMLKMVVLKHSAVTRL